MQQRAHSVLRSAGDLAGLLVRVRRAATTTTR
jgi:hypothetical protein